MGEPRLKCPDCGRRGVTMRLGLFRGEDVYRCRYCDWGCFARSERYDNREDRAEQRRLNAANGILPTADDLLEALRDAGVDAMSATPPTVRITVPHGDADTAREIIAPLLPGIVIEITE